MDLLTRFEQSLHHQKMILPGDKVFVACSGGPDSAGLFHLLLALKEKWNLKLGLLHFNHGLRPAAAGRDERFVKNLARKSKIPFYSGRGKVNCLAKRHRTSPEETARNARYEFFARAAKIHRIPKIASAHTQDDQAETVLMRMLQGTGLRGLSGIRSEIRMGKTKFIRPLLEFTKQELLHYLKENRIPFRTDSSNLSNRFVRNRLRHKVMPWLAREFNPRVVETLARIPAIVKEENELLAELEQAAWKKAVKRHRRRKLDMNRKMFLDFPSSLQFRILDRALRKLDPKSGLGFEAWQKLKTNLSRRSFRTSFPRDIDFSLTPVKLSVYKKYARP